MPGQIIYRGPSLLDGQPLVVVAIWSSKNRKTGDMLQTYILRADMDPRDASRTGADYSICGNCPHRGQAHDGDSGQALNRSCYVLLGQGPLKVWQGIERGLYRETFGHAALASLGAGRLVRLGTYGDPAAVPGYIWDSLLSQARGHTAYTHQSGVPGAQVDVSRFMVSADSRSQAEAAWQAGARTFRVVAAVADLVPGREVLCPASEEAGRRSTCETCKLCAGASVRAKSVAIVAHGSGKRHALALAAA